VDAGTVQRFIDIDVSHARQERLIEKQRLELAFSGEQFLLEQLKCEVVLKGFRTQFAKQIPGVAHPVNTSEFARVAEAEFPAVIKMEHGMDVVIRFGPWRAHVEVSAHPQVDEQRPFVKWENEILAPSLHSMEGATLDSTPESGERRSIHVAGPGSCKSKDTLTGQGSGSMPGTKRTGDRFDFR
jgi:hypothetical protein